MKKIKTLISTALTAAVLTASVGTSPAYNYSVCAKKESIINRTVNLEEKTALMIVDMQEDFVGDINKKEYNEELPNYLKLIDFAKKKNMPIYILEFAGAGNTIKPLKERLGQYVTNDITKTYSNGFKETDLKEKLEDKGIKNIIMSGIFASGCVYDTAYDAVTNGFNIITSREIISDSDPNWGPEKNECVNWYNLNGYYKESFDELLNNLD